MVVQKIDIHQGPPYIHRLTDECTTTYIRRLTDEYIGLYSSVRCTLLGLGIEEFSSIIFFGIEEYKKIEKDTLFSCSGVLDWFHAVAGSSGSAVRPRLRLRDPRCRLSRVR
jgi:hypothetical protein